VLATAMMVAMFPQIIFGPFIGPFVDRWNRKKIMIFADLAIALLTVLLVVLFYAKTIQIWHIYVVMAARSIGNTFQYPAMGASIPMIVPEKHLARANGLFMTLQGLINIVGPPVGAFLMESLPMQGVLSVDIITAVIAVACLLPLVIPQPPRTTLSAKANVIKDMVQGFRYIWSWRGLMVLGVLFSLINFFGGPIASMMPIFVARHLGAEVLRLGWLDTAFGVGMIAGGLILGAWGGFKRRIITCFLGLIIAGSAVIILGLTTIDLFLMGVAMMFLIGLGIVFCNAPISAIIQSVVDKDMQGRLGTTLNAITGAMIPLGLAIAGPVADAVGIRPIFYFAGGAILLLVLTGSFSRDLMNIEKQKSPEKPALESQST
jgi:DHA3 family macrolide efflux protein-like MFS transporter